MAIRRPGRWIPPLSISNLVLVFSAVATLLAAGVVLAVSAYVRDRAIHDLARDEAHQTSVLIFETLYSAMRKGWTKDEIGDVIHRLQSSRPDLTIRVVRGDPVVRQFGQFGNDQEVIDTDPLMATAMRTGAEQLAANETAIRYLYPVLVRPECQACHTEAKVGEVNGVIDVLYPVRNLKVSLNFMVNTVILVFMVVIIFLTGAMYLKLRAFVAGPIIGLVGVMKEIIQHTDLSKRIDADHHWVTEVSTLTTYFNKLLTTIQDYQQKVEELSIKDPLTGLYNRRKFEEFLSYEIERSGRHKHNFSILMFDLDNFKQINDTYGHAIGDLALRKLAQMLDQTTRRTDILARLGGDEFALILPETDVAQGFSVAEKLRQTIAEYSLELPIGKLRIAASIGVVGFPDNGTEFQRLVIAMDVAMYKAKRAGKNRAATIGTADEEALMAVFSNGERVRRALDEGRLIAHAQPIVDTTTGLVVAYELLARIREGDAILIAGQFIEVAEELGLAQRIDEAVIERGLDLLKRLKASGKAVKLFLNLSPRTLANTEYMGAFPDRLLADGLDPSQIVFELTEREALPHLKDVIKLIDALRAHGIGFALDDFGSGFSSFGYLKYLTVDYVKIEGSFVRHLVMDEKDRIMVEHIAAMSRQFGVRTIAEFVEDEETLEALREMGIDWAQGYHCGMPADADTIFDLPPVASPP